MTRRSRRAFLAGAGAVLAGTAGCLGDGEAQSRWEPAESPTGKTLHAVTATAVGPYAVGESGRLLGRCHIGWAQVLKHGPAHGGNTLYDVAATDDGRAIWFVGDSGAVGRFDVVASELADHSAPDGKTSSWEAVGVAGTAGSEQVYLLNGSGELVHGSVDGDDVSWDDPTKPGSGTNGEAVAFGENGFGYVCDSGGEVFKTVDGETWKQVGIDGTSNTLFDLVPFGKEQAAAAAENGVVYRYNGFEWTGLQVGTASLFAIDHGKRSGLAVGEGGVIYALGPDGWEQDPLRASGALYGVTLGAGSYPPVAVGESGTIVERPRPEDR